MQTIRPRTAFLFVALASCAGTLEDPDRFRETGSLGTQPRADGDGGGAAGPSCPDVPQTVLSSASCAASGCHAPPLAAASLDLASPGVAGRLVGVAAKSGGLLIDPAGVEQSVLYKRLLPDGSPRMPIGQPLDDATIACVRTWISSLGTTPGSPGTGTDGGVTPGMGTVVRVAAGATAAYTDPAGLVWAADTGFTGGATNQFPAVAIGKTTTPSLYLGERYGRPEVPAGFSYAFPVAKGKYTVTLKFAENYFTAEGGRKFHVSINGAQVLTDFDIVAAAPGKDVAVDRPFPVDVASDGPITIAFAIGSASGPKISAIEIVPAP